MTILQPLFRVLIVSSIIILLKRAIKNTFFNYSVLLGYKNAVTQGPNPLVIYHRIKYSRENSCLS